MNFQPIPQAEQRNVQENMLPPLGHGIPNDAWPSHSAPLVAVPKREPPPQDTLNAILVTHWAAVGLHSISQAGEVELTVPHATTHPPHGSS